MITNRYFAEFFGTATLILVGCGSVVLGGMGASQPLGGLPIALSFGLVLAGLIYALGPISGCHINPAVTIAAWIAGRLERAAVPGYIAAQLLGGIVGAGLLALISTNGISEVDLGAQGLGQNGWGEGYLGEYNVIAAFSSELIATFLFVAIILGTTTTGGHTAFAGVAIGLTLTAMIVTFIGVSGASLNPARSLGPALFVGAGPIAQLWLFFLAPVLGGALAGLLFRET